MSGIDGENRKMSHVPIQYLLDGQYLRIVRLHKDLHDLSIIPHRHDHYEIVFATEGEGTHSINFRPFDIKPNRVYFIHPGQVHLIDAFDRNGWLIMFGEELFKRFLSIHKHEDGQGLLDLYTPNPYVDLDGHLLKTIHFIVGQLQTELSAAKPNIQIMLHYVSLLLLHTNNAHHLQHPQAQSSLANLELFDKLKRLIEHNFKQEHLASFYAKTLRTDIKKLNNICRTSTHMTVAELLQERLITESKILLQTSVRSVKEISYELGFNDPAFFGRFFKKSTGTTPAAFRSFRML